MRKRVFFLGGFKLYFLFFNLIICKELEGVLYFFFFGDKEIGGFLFIFLGI